MMDVSGAWVRKPEVSSADRMNAWADEKERQFVARYLGGLTDSLETTLLLTGIKDVRFVTW